ncbi:methenyltetrahydrofolate cyclohydrolase [Methylicorpusculum sp.]|uniref:methenyltetrahydrofolate cyclohydrolase n=1 Tax=Methylicorpusculum sp. TaxID=2713644 RepID=UPI0027316BC6|nr:methenyltetrahydrofolate cyclohydrolase [Methylicorpusculum sp.]MDP2176959.1 cyclodeaminase/cyclohydrolase family protein [Methylicorpusculum sp.]MDP3528729.1 cyclodeaminase/cyclohydrolase family protein [Methylicorpusculum sp.]MDZ4154254.1 cyclodeaminase/cyclohydrolase family protein [Methylicorpusculum sp.]
MTDIKDKTLHLFLDELASKTPTPGGGSAAAFMGAQSAALTSMVCNLTLGKPKYAAVETDMQQLLKQSEVLRQQLTGMIKADVEVFERLMAAYGLPKDSDEQIAARSESIQKQLKEATLVPMACARACASAIKLSRIAAEKGNLGVISDAGVAAMAGYAGLKSAALNVYINAGSLKDKEFAEQALKELEEILKFSSSEAENVYRIVKEKF